MIRQYALMLLVILVTMVPVTHSTAQDGEPPDLILIEETGMHPEGIEWDAANEQFLVGSIGLGSVFAIGDDGTVTPFVESDNLVSSIGIHIDTTTDRLLVAQGNPWAFVDNSVVGIAQFGIYDMDSGEELFFIDLASLYPDSRYMANDVTSDDDGNAYVTDSFSPIIYKVDVDGNAEIFVEDEALLLGNNGIDYHPDGYLLVATGGTNSIVKIPLDDPSSLTPVELSEPLGIDGMVIDENLDLVAVATTLGEDDATMSEVVVVHSEDDWMTATVISRGVAIPENSPTTVALREGHAYVVHAHFAELLAEQEAEAFEIMRVDLDEQPMDDDDMSG